MIKNIGVVVVGFGIWFTANLVVLLTSVFIWQHSPDRYASIALQCFIGTTLGLILAAAAKERIGSRLPNRTFFIILGAVVLLWRASSLTTGVEIDFKLVSLAAHALAIGIAIWHG